MSRLLPKIIKKKKDIQQIIKQGEKRKGKYLVVFRQDSQGGGFRFCVLVSNKIKKAVRRNRIKRLLREVVRKNKNLLKSSERIGLLYPLDLKEVSYAELEADFKSLFI